MHTDASVPFHSWGQTNGMNVSDLSRYSAKWLHQLPKPAAHAAAQA